jgi:hypothetical protein
VNPYSDLDPALQPDGPAWDYWPPKRWVCLWMEWLERGRPGKFWYVRDEQLRAELERLDAQRKTGVAQ